MTRVVLAGATGWAGSALARGIARHPDLELVAAVARSAAGRPLGEVLGVPTLTSPVFATATEALGAGCDVFVEFTKPDSAKGNILAALDAGAHVVVGTSGLGDDDYRAIDVLARARGRGVLACGNFAITAVLLQKFAEQAARYLEHFEIIDYAHEDKVDAPSGTARELAHRVGTVRTPAVGVPLDAVRGPREARGAELSGVRVHSLRLPGYVIAVEAIFGSAGQRLHLKHEASSTAEPYVDGALLAIRKVNALLGVHRGLDAVMDD
ncbi:MAG: 4-hydroxy-tetrahydrodipicolinate reductase [Burkholderiaceae bacterium]